MSDRARAFLINWLSEHANPLPATRRMAEAVRLATACRKDATAADIPLKEIRHVSDGDLIMKILQALDTTATRSPLVIPCEARWLSRSAP
jgi:hypothetical protein